MPSESKGVVVTDISPSSPVAETGLRRGDVIQEVNHQPVKNVAEFEQAMKKAGKDSLLWLIGAAIHCSLPRSGCGNVPAGQGHKKPVPVGAGLGRLLYFKETR